jgi:hypothetical protein
MGGIGRIRRIGSNVHGAIVSPAIFAFASQGIRHGTYLAVTSTSAIFNPSTQLADDISGESNAIRLGEVSTHTAARIAGIYGSASTSSSATLVYAVPTGHTVTSSTANLTLGGVTTGTFSGNGSNFTGITVPASSVTGTVAGGQLANASSAGRRFPEKKTRAFLPGRG